MMTIEKEKIKLNINEIKRYMHYAPTAEDPRIDSVIHSSIATIDEIAIVNYTYKVSSFQIEEDRISIDNFTEKIKSEDLANHLRGAKAIVVFAVTLGQSVDRELKKVMILDSLKALSLDAVASTYIERVADIACEEIMLQSEGHRNYRYSPGYGDLLLTYQPAILDFLEAQKKIGLFLNDKNLLIPSKSITAFFGIFDTKKEQKKSCETCSLVDNCQFRQKGVMCFDR